MQMQIKQLSTGQDDVPEEISEDIRLMRGSRGSERCSKSLTQFEGVYSRHHAVVKIMKNGKWVINGSITNCI